MAEHSIGKTIAELRKVKGWTQVELAERLNVSDKTINSNIKYLCLLNNSVSSDFLSHFIKELPFREVFCFYNVRLRIARLIIRCKI